MEAAARITAKGQVTIPAVIRRGLDLDVGDEVIFEVDPAPGSPHAQLRKAADFMALLRHFTGQPFRICLICHS